MYIVHCLFYNLQTIYTSFHYLQAGHGYLPVSSQMIKSVHLATDYKRISLILAIGSNELSVKYTVANRMRLFSC